MLKRYCISNLIIVDEVEHGKSLGEVLPDEQIVCVYDTQCIGDQLPYICVSTIGDYFDMLERRAINAESVAFQMCSSFKDAESFGIEMNKRRMRDYPEYFI